ncbi:hypothetical protein HDV05_008561 [Chytridiales sp. JEL 0842]|nr:hypothetical protein HDV05_008561 [Chytridiales sp. JEL 0842]
MDLNKRLQYLHDASHTLQATCPSLARFYISALLETANLHKNRLTLADRVRKKFCSVCGSIFVPGLNCGVRTVGGGGKGRRNKKNEKRDSGSLAEIESKMEVTAKPGLSKETKTIRPRHVDLKLNSATKLSQSSSSTDTLRKLPNFQSHIVESGATNLVVYMCFECGSDTRMVGSTQDQLVDATRDKQSTTIASLKPAPASADVLTVKRAAPIEAAPVDIPSPNKQPKPEPPSKTSIPIQHKPINKQSKQKQKAASLKKASTKANLKSLLQSKASAGSGGFSLSDFGRK